MKLQIHELTVRVCTDEATPGSYRFAGARSAIRRSTRAASPRIVNLLVSAGAPHELWQWPAELAERPGGPALTPDDLLDLHVLLADDGWFDELVALVRSTTPE